MKLYELFSALSYGELSNLAMAIDGNGTIREEDRPKVVLATNDALTRLFSRFNLSERDILVEQVGHITNYHLIPKYAEASYDPEEVRWPYIKDLPVEPFLGDIIKILSVTDSFGRVLPLNDPEQHTSLFTPKHNMLQVPAPIHGASLAVHYQAAHPKISDDLDGGEQDIWVPDVLYGALRAFIAYKIYSAINTQEATVKAQEHLNLYESICTEAIEKDLVNTSVSQTNSKFEKRGFV